MNAPPPGPRRAALGDEIMLQRIGEAMVVLNAATGQYYELNDSAADMLEIWLQQDGDHKRAVAELAARYATKPQTLSADLAVLLRELTAAGIIEAG